MPSMTDFLCSRVAACPAANRMTLASQLLMEAGKIDRLPTRKERLDRREEWAKAVRTAEDLIGLANREA